MNEQMALEMAIRARQQLAGIDATIRKIKEMKASFQSFAASIQNHVRKVIAAFAKLQAAIKKMQNGFRTLRNTALKAFMAIVALNGIPIKFFADFEQKMANVNTLLDVSEKKFQQMGQGVISISNKIGESATTLSTALYDIVSAGVDASDSLAVLDTSARAAKAGMTQAQTAVNAGLATINAYNMGISELNHVYDLQFQTVRKGVITYEQLAGAQGQLLPSAKKLNESLENMYGALSYVTKSGLSADMASISLARTFDGLTTKADKLAQYGIQVYDEFGKFRGLLPVMEDFSASLQGLTDEQVMDVLNNIGFDIRAARSIIPMITNIDGLRESILAMKDSTGSMQEAFEKATNTISFRFNRAKENVINAFRLMGEGWREEINDLLDKVAAMAGALQEFVVKNKDAIKSIVLFAAKLAGIITLIGLVGSAIFALMTPMGAITAGIAILGAAWYLNLWDIRGITQKVVEYVLNKWDALKEWWQNTTWMEKIAFVWDSAVGAIQSLGDWVKDKLDLNDDGTVTLGEVIDVAINIGKWLWDVIGEPIWESLKNWVLDKYDADEDGTLNFAEAMDFALDASLLLGTATAAFTLLALTKWIAGALAAIGVIGAQALGALALGMTIGATLSVLLDPNVQNYEDWKNQFIEGLQLLFTEQFWRDLWYIMVNEFGKSIYLLQAAWQGKWNQMMDWVSDKIILFFSKEFWSDVWDTMKTSFQQAWKDLWVTDNEMNVTITRQMHDDAWNPPGGFKANGGYISGPGTGTSDSIPAMLSNGEFVINAKATRKWLPLLEKINSGNMPGFKYGGLNDTYMGSGTGYVEANMYMLEQAGLQDNAALSYLAKIAHDSGNFQNIVSLIAGVQNMQQKYKELMDGREKEKEKLLEGLLENTDPEKQKADTSINWNSFVNTLRGLFDKAIQDLDGVLSRSTVEFLTGITSALETFSKVDGGLFGSVDENGKAIPGVIGELKNAWSTLMSGGGIKAALGQLSEGTIQGIAQIFDGIKNAIIASVQEAAQKAASAFNRAIEKFNDAIGEFRDSISQGGSLKAAGYDYQSAIEQAQKSAEAYATKLAKERQAEAAKKGGGIGGLLGGIIGFFVGGPAGAMLGAGIGGAGGAAVGALGDYYKDSDYAKKLEELLKEVKEKINELLEQSFGLDTNQITANIDNAIMSATESGDNLALAIGKSIYGSIKNSLQSVFLWAQNNVIQQYLSPVIENMKEKITNSIVSGKPIDFKNLIDIDQLIAAAKAAEGLGKDLQQYMADLKQQLIDAGIGQDIIDAIFPPDQLTQQIMQALGNAMSSAMESGNLSDFSKSLGQAIYDNAKQGLIQAFMESKVYQEMFAKWFDTSGMEFTGNLEEDFAAMQEMLAELQQQLREAGLDFNYTEVATSSGANNTTSSDYYAGDNHNSEGATVINKKYIYAPEIGKLYADSDEELFRQFLKWKKSLEDEDEV